MKNNLYIISDVHGCIKTLKALIKKLPSESKICFVGDLIDRGLYSKEVVNFVMINNYDCVLGNHEAEFIKTLDSIISNQNNYHEDSTWYKSLGGQKTLQSYNINSIEDLTEENLTVIKKHLDFLKTLPLYKEYKDVKTKNNRHLVISHSHFADKWKYKDMDKISLEYKSFEKYSLSSRFKNFDNEDIYNVYGHTPLDKPQIDKHKACIDLGCVFDNKENLKGYLCALGFPSLNVLKQENIE